MRTEEYDELVRFFHDEGYGWRKAQEEADDVVEKREGSKDE